MKEDSVSPYPVLSGRLNYRRHGLDSELVRLSDQPQHLLQNRHQCAVHGNDVVPDYDVISAMGSAVNKATTKVDVCPESRFGLAVRRYSGKRKDLGSIPLRLSFRFKSCGLWTCTVL